MEEYIKNDNDYQKVTDEIRQKLGAIERELQFQTRAKRMAKSATERQVIQKRINGLNNAKVSLLSELPRL